MAFKIFEHELVPRHEILGRDEAKQLLARLKITSMQLPKILLNDPVAVELKAKLGDIIKIHKKSPTAGETTYYRVVIKG